MIFIVIASDVVYRLSSLMKQRAVFPVFPDNRIDGGYDVNSSGDSLFK